MKASGLSSKLKTVNIASKSDGSAIRAEAAQLEAIRYIKIAEELRIKLKIKTDNYESVISEKTEALKNSENRLLAVYNSTTWRLMGPFRRLGRRFPRLTIFLKRSIYLILKKFPNLVTKVDLTVGQPSQDSLYLSSQTTSTSAKKIVSSDQRKLCNPVQTASLGLKCSSKVNNICIGIVTYNTSKNDFLKLISSANVAIGETGAQNTKILYIDNGRELGVDKVGNRELFRLPTVGNIGFGAAHNLLMRDAFNQGAEVYIAANPDGLFHPHSLSALVQMSNAHNGRSLIEASQFPLEHSKIYNPETFETPWASGACMLVPRVIFEDIGGFDAEFFMYCEDVDYSWRARVSGFSVRICPRARYFHAITNRKPTAVERQRVLESSILLSSKWGNSTFQKDLIKELNEMGVLSPKLHSSPVELDWRRVADFSHSFYFSPIRW